MEKLNLQSDEFKQITENWIKPEVVVLSVTDITQGLGGGGPDFGSEVS